MTWKWRKILCKAPQDDKTAHTLYLTDWFRGSSRSDYNFENNWMGGPPAARMANNGGPLGCWSWCFQVITADSCAEGAAARKRISQHANQQSLTCPRIMWVQLARQAPSPVQISKSAYFPVLVRARVGMCTATARSLPGLWIKSQACATVSDLRAVFGHPCIFSGHGAF